MKKRILIFIATFIIFLLIGVIILPFITISSEQLTRFITSQLEKNLARKVEIGNLKIGILRGIELNNVIIFNKSGFSSKALIENKRVILKYKFLPLIKRRLVITKLLLVEPKVFIERNKANEWNFTDLLKTQKNPSSRTTNNEKAKFSLQLDNIRVKNGLIHFLDEKILPKFEIAVKKIDIRIEGLNKREGIIGFRITAGKIGGKRVNFKLRGGVEVDLDLGLIEIVTAKFTLADLEAEVEGGLKDEIINLELESNEFSISNIIRLIPLSNIEKLKILGKSKINVGINGRVDEKLDVLGAVRLKKGKVGYDGVRKYIKNINLELQFTEEDISLSSLSGKFGKSDFNIQAELQNFKNPKINLIFNSKRIILDEIIDSYYEFVAINRATDLNLHGAIRPAFERHHKQFNLDVEGEINIDKWSFKKIIGERLFTDFRWVRNVLMIRTLKSDVSNGWLETSAMIDLNSQLPQYFVSAKVKQVEIANIISSFDIKKKFICGKLTSEINLKGAGFKLNDLKENLAGTGNIELKDAKLKGLKILDKLATFLSLGVIRNLTQCHLLATFKIAQGIISTDDFELRSKFIKLLASGKISLDLDVDFNVTATFPGRLGRQIAKLGRIIPFIGDEKGRMGVRFRVKGNFKDPKFSKKEKIKEIIEKKHERIKEKVKEKAQEEIKKLFKRLF